MSVYPSETPHSAPWQVVAKYDNQMQEYANLYHEVDPQFEETRKGIAHCVIAAYESRQAAIRGTSHV